MVVTDGLTDSDDPATEPMPGARVRAVASDTFQESRLLWPAVIVAGVAVKLAMAGGCGVGWTLTVAVAVMLPAGLLAVSV